ncbi:hypothetical protein V5F77_24705 [Xanthobacter sp. DSM 24535]|uniref:hypothetical protein n=1 Tax=Roseixanthobacter psychrophilus TaxID=3119917 RepID=UPI0037292452
MAENYRGWDVRASDPAVRHAVLVYPGMNWPSSGRIDLGIGPEGAVRERWRFLSFETAGTVLIEDESGIAIPYTRPAGVYLPLSGVALWATIATPINGISATSASLLLYGMK